MSDERKLLAGRMLAAQTAYRSAVARYRRERSEENRFALEAAQKVLDDIQRIAVVEHAPVSSKRY